MNKAGAIIFGIIIVILIGFTVYGVQYRAERDKEIAALDQRIMAENEAEKKQKELEKKKHEEEQKALFEKRKEQTLVYFPMGDSLADGAYASTDDKKYVSVLAQTIKDKLGYNIEVKDGATKGGTGLKDFGIPNASKVVQASPDLITIEFGTNDLSEKRTEAYSTPEEFEKRLNDLIDYIQTNSKKQPKIILVTTWKSGNDSLKYDSIILKVGKEKSIPVANIEPVWQNRSNTSGPEGVSTSHGLSDNWHPNDLGHSEIAANIYAIASKLFE